MFGEPDGILLGISLQHETSLRIPHTKLGAVANYKDRLAKVSDWIGWKMDCNKIFVGTHLILERKL